MDLEEELTRRICRSRQFEAAIEEAVDAGAAGDRALVAALRDGPRSRQVFIAHALRFASGPDGPAALRRGVMATGPGTRDLRFVSIMSLAIREQESASADLLQALTRTDLIAPTLWVLPLWADDRAWDAALRGVEKEIMGRRDSAAFDDGAWDAVLMPAFCGVVYLAKYAAQRERADRLLGLLHRRHARFGPVEQRALQPLVAALRSEDRPADVSHHIARLDKMLARRRTGDRY